MDDAQRELVRAWLIKADHDLLTARRLSMDPQPILDTAIYHCQQAGEKALKGVLALRNLTIPRTHDLAVLAGLASQINPAFAAIVSEAAGLTPFATAYRYPGATLAPSKAEFDEALRSAERIFALVLHQTPLDVHP